jgi:hypothetical protein
MYTGLELIRVGAEHQSALGNLLELYIHDFSDLVPLDDCAGAELVDGLILGQREITHSLFSPGSRPTGGCVSSVSVVVSVRFGTPCALLRLSA